MSVRSRFVNGVSPVLRSIEAHADRAALFFPKEKPVIFGERVSTETGFAGLRAIHVGGGLTNCSIFETAFGRFKDAEFLHLHGSSEAEPVASMGAREAVDRSRVVVRDGIWWYAGRSSQSEPDLKLNVR